MKSYNICISKKGFLDSNCNKISQTIIKTTNILEGTKLHAVYIPMQNSATSMYENEWLVFTEHNNKKYYLINEGNKCKEISPITFEIKLDLWGIKMEQFKALLEKNAIKTQIGSLAPEKLKNKKNTLKI